MTRWRSEKTTRDILDETGAPFHAFVTQQGVIAIGIDGGKKISDGLTAEVITSTIEDAILDVIKVRYTCEMKEVKALDFYSVKEALTDVVQQVCLDAHTNHIQKVWTWPVYGRSQPK